MAQLLNKITLISLVTLLTACSSDNVSKQQVSGSMAYLNAPTLKTLESPEGMIIPIPFSDYEIPVVETAGKIGKELDIRPPVLPMALLNGSRVIDRGNTVALMLEGSVANPHLLRDVLAVMKSKGYQIEKEEGSLLDTDWISWPRKDEKTPYQARYKIDVRTQSSQSLLAVTIQELQRDQQNETAPELMASYAATMLNSLSSGLQQQNKQVAEQETTQRQLAVQQLIDEK